VRVGLWIAVPVRGLTVVMTPLVVVFETLMRPLTQGPREPSTNEAEIRLLARIGRSEGTIEADELEMLHRVFQLNDRLAQDLMTPRTAVTWLDAGRGSPTRVQTSWPRSTAVSSWRTAGWIVSWGSRSSTSCWPPCWLSRQPPWASMRVEVEAVPWLLRADHLLERFRQRREHLALVIDEYGGTMGVVTLEDVLEVLTGPILDETDRRHDLRAYARARGRHKPRSQR
jgi:CBS domain containing-hemolysin-like protein